jgi:uncharacterized protein YjbI with pentapeptide repeats
VKSPRTLGDLRFAPELAAFPRHSPLEFDGDYDRVLFAGQRFADAGAGGARFAECAFTDGTWFEGGRLRRCRFTDVWFGQVRFVTADLAESSLTDTWFSGCAFAGVGVQ